MPLLCKPHHDADDGGKISLFMGKFQFLFSVFLDVKAILPERASEK